MARDLRLIDHVLIGCSGSPNGLWVPITQVDIWDAHAGLRRQRGIAPDFNPGLAAIGWHYVIGTNGALWSARHYREPGGHAGEFNGCSIQICLIGLDRYTPAQFDMLRDHLCVLATRFAQWRKHPLTPGIRYGTRVAPSHARDLLLTMNVRVRGLRQPGFDAEEWFRNHLQPPAGALLDANLEVA